MARRITISLGQMAIRKGDPDHNLACMREWTIEAARRGSDLVVFPELWDTGYALDRATELASPLDEGRFAQVANLAREHHIHIVGSMLEIDADGKAYNTLAWFNPAGERLGTYRKIHLFRLMDEDKYLHGGDAPLLLDVPWGRTGTAICYDLRFPELFRAYAVAGAVLIVVPSEWPHPRLAHWQTLLRARAIENQVFIAACNGAGSPDFDTRLCGHSILLDAWGTAVVGAGEAPVLLTASVDLDEVAQIRESIPVFADRRPDLYKFQDML